MGTNALSTPVVISSPAMAFHLDAISGWSASLLENRITGACLKLHGGPELELEWDAAIQRIWIEGWRCQTTDEWTGSPDDERGMREGYARPDCPDHEWPCQESPGDLYVPEPSRYAWARTRLFVPREPAEGPLTLVLGGMDLYDFRFMRVFLNGVLVGERQAALRWNEPARFDLSAGTPAGSLLRRGHVNTLALQLCGQITRTAVLDAQDPGHGRHYPMPNVLCTPFLQYLVVGADRVRASLRVDRVQVEPDRHGCTVTLRDQAGETTATIVYRLSADEPLLFKSVRITNTASCARRLMNVGHGAYTFEVPVTDGGRGFPVYVDGQAFVSLADPAGWTTGQDQRIRLSQFPGRLLQPGETFTAMDTVWGVAPAGKAQELFVETIRRRCRRVRRNHDQPMTIFEPFGGWDTSPDSGNSWVEESESILNGLLDRLAEARSESDLQFDRFSVDFWVDKKGDLTGFDPCRFPNGFVPLRDRIRALGMDPGLWIDSSMSGWHILDNPAIVRTFTHNPAFTPKFWSGPFTCRATDPIRTLFCTAFRHHVREHGVRLLKFDNLRAICNNITHDHLPGLYSTEAIHDGVRQMLHELDAENPDVFLMLYWGYRSPWWLLDADTLFEPGLAIEAATPGIRPTLYARDGVTQGLDLAHRWCADLPAIGKDSLGVWLSSWDWNSGIGPERWAAGFVMDLARGSLLAQPWSDPTFLDAPQRRCMADLIALFRRLAGCFAGSRLVLGNPWQMEPYGYCGSDGTRAVIALHNATWEDRPVTIRLDASWGLPSGRTWSIYSHFPDYAQWSDPGESFQELVSFSMRPFEVRLLELVPAGEAPGLSRSFERKPVPATFPESSWQLPMVVRQGTAGEALPLAIETKKDSGVSGPVAKQVLRFEVSIPAHVSNARLAITLEVEKQGRLVSRQNPGHYFAGSFALNGRDLPAVPALSRGYPAGWQTWRIDLPPSADPVQVGGLLTVAADTDMQLVSRAYWLPW